MKKLALVCLLMLAGCAADFGRAPVEERFISLRYPHTNEVVSVTYVRNWQYSGSAMEKINHICRDRHNGEETDIDPKLIDFIADLRDRTGLPENATFDIISCYRSPETNAELARTDHSVARASLHTKGKAVDLRVTALAANAMAEVAKTMQRGGVAWYPKTGHVHIDTGGVRTWAVR